MARGLQKVQSQLKSAGNTSKTAEERAADRKKSEAAATGQICLLCRQTFSNVAKEPMLRAHWESKHPKETVPAFCVEACAAAEAKKKAAADSKKGLGAGGDAKPKPKKKKDDDLSALLDAGLAGVGKKK